MSTQIQGTKFLYEIDKKDFPDGFIASGTESDRCCCYPAGEQDREASCS